METEKNPFGNSIGIVSEGSPFEGLSGKLISKLAFHMSDTGITWGMHFFGTWETIGNTWRKCDSIITFWWGNVPTDIIDKIMYKDGKPVGFEFFGPERTPIVQINFSWEKDILNPKKFFRASFDGQKNKPWDISRMDLVDIDEWAEEPGKKLFAIRNVTTYSTKSLLSQSLALKVAEIMDIPSINIAEDWSDVLKELKGRHSRGRSDRTHSY